MAVLVPLQVSGAQPTSVHTCVWRTSPLVDRSCAQDLCVRAVAANFERSSGALASVPAACAPHVLRLLGTDVQLQLAVPASFPARPCRLLKRSFSEHTVLTLGAVARSC